jgi:hypothetical protein
MELIPGNKGKEFRFPKLGIMLQHRWRNELLGVGYYLKRLSIRKKNCHEKNDLLN